MNHLFECFHSIVYKFSLFTSVVSKLHLRLLLLYLAPKTCIWLSSNLFEIKCNRLEDNDNKRLILIACGIANDSEVGSLDPWTAQHLWN